VRKLRAARAAKANLSRDANNKCGVLPVLPRELGVMPRHDNPEPTAGGHDRFANCQSAGVVWLNLIFT
jgi:hypothetical protein